MGFRINTNIAGVNAHVYGVMNNRDLHESLAKLSSGLRINKAADDASGMAIADSLRSQTSALGQAIRNANDAIGMIQTADRAMEEQITILDVVKQKAIQSAQDGQTSKSRKALQEDISRLLEELDNIANTTSFNGQEMLSGSFVNKEFQIGAFSNTTIRASIGDTNSQKIGHVRYETNSITTDSMLPVSGGVTNLKTVTLNFLQVDGANNKQIETVAISTSAGTGLGELARVINKNKDQLNVKANANVIAHGLLPVAPGDIGNLVVNGVIIGNITGIKRNDSDGRLVNAINDVKLQTGIEASVDIQGRLQLTSIDGRAISIDTDSGAYLLNGYSTQAKMVSAMPVAGRSDLYGTSVHGHHAFIGRLTFIRLGGRDVVVSGINVSAIGMLSSQGVAETTVNLAAVKGIFNANVASAAGANANMATQSVHADGIGTGVTSYWGAQIVLDLADSALTFLDTIRADLGSSQIQLTHTINNISITQVNVKAAESQIRDVDFAEESRNFSKHNILAQSGSFAMAQANQIQSNVMRLLQ